MARFIPVSGFKYMFGHDNTNPNDLREPKKAYMVEDDRVGRVEVVLCWIGVTWRAFHFGTGIEMSSNSTRYGGYPCDTRSECLEYIVEHFKDVGEDKMLNAISKQTIIYTREKQ